VFAPTYWTARQGITQTIFPGAHSDVGGGYAETGLSDGALHWMLGRLTGVGIDFPSPPGARPDPEGVGHDDSVTFPFLLLPKRPRAFPADARPDGSIGLRWGQMCTVIPAGVSEDYASRGTYADGEPIHS
jgi:glutathione S-transferase